jgi:DDE superfamily endonuclease
VLDLYEGRWEGELLHPGDYVVCADEKPSIQARGRCHPTLPAAPGGGLRVEHEYERKGALCYLAAWDVRRARIFDRCAAKDGIVPFDALVEQFMSVEPYRCAQRVFVIVDNGSAHRGQRSIDRLQGAWPNLILVHTPVHASWLNQAEIFFSVVQRKVLTPTTSQASTPSSNDYTRSPDTTNRSPNRSNGSSPDKTSTSSSPAPATTSTSGWPHDPTTQLRNGPLRERRRPS